MLEYRWANPDTRLFFYQRGNAGYSDIIGKTLKGQFLTVEEAMTMANDFMAQMAPDYELRVVFWCRGRKRRCRRISLPGLLLHLHPPSPMHIIATSTRTLRIGLWHPRLVRNTSRWVIHGDQIVNFHWQDPYEIGAIIPKNRADTLWANHERFRHDCPAVCSKQ